jgi:hypothetical protein
MEDRHSLFYIWDLRMEKFTHTSSVVSIKWKEELESGPAQVKRVVITAEQYDEVMKEFFDKLALVYRP